MIASPLFSLHGQVFKRHLSLRKNEFIIYKVPSLDINHLSCKTTLGLGRGCVQTVLVRGGGWLWKDELLLCFFSWGRQMNITKEDEIWNSFSCLSAYKITSSFYIWLVSSMLEVVWGPRLGHSCFRNHSIKLQAKLYGAACFPPKKDICRVTPIWQALLKKGASA